MRRIVIVVLLVCVAWTLGACNMRSDQTPVASNQPHTNSAPALQPVAERTVVADRTATAYPSQTPEQQAACEALEKRALEIDRGYVKRLDSNGKMITDPNYLEVNKGITIDRRGWTDKGLDKEYKALKDCLRSGDENLRQERPLLSFGDTYIANLRFGMTKEEILKTGLFDGGAKFQPHWYVDSCRQIDSANAAAMYPTVSVCMLWHGTELNEEHDKSYLQVRFDSDNKLVAWAYFEFFDRKSPQHPRYGWANSSDVVREVRHREAGLARLEIPDTEDDHQANWYFVSRSEKNKNGFPKILEMASLTVSKQGNYWGIDIDYSDESKK